MRFKGIDRPTQCKADPPLCKRHELGKVRLQ